MKKQLIVLIVGLAAGVLDLVPLILVGAPIFNMAAILVFWLVACLFMAKTGLVKNTILNGLLIAVLLMMPLILTVSAVNPKDFLPMLSMAVILGPIAGWIIGKAGGSD